MYVIPKLVAGIFSFLLVGLVVVGPVYLAEKLEIVEISSQELISFSELQSHNVPLGYIPYMDLNLSNRGIFDYSGDKYGYYGFTFPGTVHTTDSVVYDYDGVIDYVQLSPATFKDLFIFMRVDWEQVQEDGADIVNIYFDLEAEKSIYIKGVHAVFTGSSYEYSEDIEITGYDTSTYDDGIIDETFELSTSELNNIVSKYGDYDFDHSLLKINLYCALGGNTVDGGMYGNLQISPEYYILSEEQLSWNNGSTYIPYIQTITPFAVHKVFMVSGGILIFVVGWIASPWGERFDKLLPINNYVKKGARKK